MTAKLWVDLDAVVQRLDSFFGDEKQAIGAFGRTVNQTFEAFVFAQVVNHYIARKWNVTLVTPKAHPSGVVRLKFNTRGKPDGYTYARCERKGVVIQVRHGLRVATQHHEKDQRPPANVVLDVAVIEDHDLSKLGTDDFVENQRLVTFGEAKHMSAFAELVANFIGLVHEMMPKRLKRGAARAIRTRHPQPFLYVSGVLYRTANGIKATIERRRLDIAIHDHTSKAFFSDPLPTKVAPPKVPTKKAPVTDLPIVEAAPNLELAVVSSRDSPLELAASASPAVTTDER